MVPKEGVLACRACGFEKEKGQSVKKKHVHEISRNARQMLVIESESDEGKPTIKAHCAECGSDKAYWWLRQLRSADESEVTITFDASRVVTRGANMTSSLYNFCPRT